MPRTLVIVESPAKAKTINKYLGPDYVVEASLGHVKDLPKEGISIDIENGFVPTYEVIDRRKDVVERLRNLARACDRVLLATDPDREGEAIASHIAEVIGAPKRSVNRIVFNEITRSGVTGAISSPRAIDRAMVDAQEARRVMDRLIGYQVSPFLWQSFSGEHRGLSAGRVQSVALRLVVERERAINSFIPIQYWNLHGHFFTGREEEIVARLVRVDGRDLKNPSGSAADLKTSEDANGEPPPRNFISTPAEAEALRKAALEETYSIKRIEKKEAKRNAPPPFTTSTLQQEAGRRLRINSKRVMQLAQKLYEGVEIGRHGRLGLITYMRTDSVRVSDEAVQMAEEFIYENYGKEYIPKSRKQHLQKSANVQDAHEAIRPTDLKVTPREVRKHVDKELADLYELIVRRFVASQMAPAVFDQTTVDIEGGDFLFRATGRITRFSGWTKVLDDAVASGRRKKSEDEESDEGEAAEGAPKRGGRRSSSGTESEGEEDRMLPQTIRKGDPLRLASIDLRQRSTKPPPRFTESLLVKEMEARGIGRPSTYAATIATIQDRGYVEQKARRLYATELGMKVCDRLLEGFPSLFDVRFTARMENDLDAIASGSSTYLKVMQGFYRPFQRSLKAAGVDGKAPARRSGERRQRLTAGRRVDRRSRSEKSEAPKPDPNVLCGTCGSPMVRRKGRTGEFYGCSRYPECRGTKPIPLGVKCPQCEQGDVVERVGGKYSSVFFGCSRYPDCRFTSSHKPVAQACARCGNPYVVEVPGENSTVVLECPKCRARG